MSNDSAAPDESAGQLSQPDDTPAEAPPIPDAAPVRRRRTVARAPAPDADPEDAPAPLAAVSDSSDAPEGVSLAPPTVQEPAPEGATPVAEPALAGPGWTEPAIAVSAAAEPVAEQPAHEPAIIESAAAAEMVVAEAAVADQAAGEPDVAESPAPWPAPAGALPPAIEIWPPAEVIDPYVDVPVSLELAYTTADVGLSDRAYERTYPYEAIEKKRRRTAGTRARKVGRELAETVILALLIFFSVKALVQNFRVEGQSMEPSMHNNQYLLVNKALYFRADFGKLHDLLPFLPGGDGEHHLFRAPRRGDVIVFKFPLDPTRDFIKRVIGVPGDTVEVRDETVFINGNPLVEDYIRDKPNYTYAPKTVPPGMYFVLGDNRRNSFDSHAWGSSCSPQQLCDFVPEENIIGQAWVTYWPFDQLGLINNKIVKPQAP